ncbi:hypothetical protein [Rubritepida flocculans]|jgi:hypothetical protein|uniref:hypothetical protein n=1 Tax=Rubritepida flocculans TaxID=182403 RepID=UPI000687367B|nr:hypothetical protein [Rubritepida flocculans]
MALLAFLALPITGCQDPEWANRAALQIGAPRANAADIRARQSTRIEDASEQRVLAEVTQVLQDLGFTIEESAPRYGVLAGSKDRDATEAGQVVAQVALTIGLALLGVHYNPVWDTDQVIRATITTRPAGPRATDIRVSFERVITTNQGTSRVEVLTSPEFSQGFFEAVRAGLARST